MKKTNRNQLLNFFAFLIMSLFLAFQVSPAAAEGYDNALKDVKGVKVLFNVSLGNPAFSNAVFWAVRNVYQDKAVSTLPEKPQAAVVFHGSAVKLLSSDRTGFDKKDIGEIDKFQDTLRQMKKEGVNLHFLLNHQYSSVRVQFYKPMHDFLTGANVMGSQELPGHGVLVLDEHPDTKHME